MGGLLLIRYGEISLKGKNRREFENRLVGNLRRMVGNGPVCSIHGRAGDVDGIDPYQVGEDVSRVFGWFRWR